MVLLICCSLSPAGAADLVTDTMVKDVNAQRAAHGLPPLVIDPELLAGAQSHAVWMAKYRSMEHARGFRENIAMGQPNTAVVIRTWMNSSGHRANILARGITRIGVGAARSCAGGKCGTIYWCQRFR